MLKNITLLEKLKPLSYLHDNANFPAYLKILAPFFQHDYKSASQEEREIFFYNLLYLAQRDLSLAHCIQHNQKSRLAIELGPDSEVKSYLKDTEYYEVVCANSAHRAMDTIRYNPETNTVTAGVKGWLSNLIPADFCTIEILDITAPAGTSAAHIIHNNETVTPDIYTICLDLRKINHTKLDAGPVASIGMKGAAPGLLTIHEALELGTDKCYLLIKNSRNHALTYTWMDYVKQCWVTVHLGVIIGLFNELKRFPESMDPILEYRLKSIELEISTLKVMWEHGLITNGNKNHYLNENKILEVTKFWNMHSTQYAKSKEVLLDVIHVTLEIGRHEFVNDLTPEGIRFKDALTYVTHMISLYRCNKKFPQYNNF